MKRFSMNKMKSPEYVKNILLPNILFMNMFLINDVNAYVDPGSGSVIVTTVLGLIAAVGYTVRKYYYNLKRMIFKRMETETENAEKTKEEEQQP